MSIEEYLEAYPIMSVLGCMQMMWYENDEDDTEAIKRWRSVLGHVESGRWREGYHEGDCTNIPASCFRCLVEEMLSDAYSILVKLNPNTDIPPPPNTDPRRKNVNRTN